MAAFALIQTRDNKVYWKVGEDSHTRLWEMHNAHDSDLNLSFDRYRERNFVDAEILPDRDDYFDSRVEWALIIREEHVPSWYSAEHVDRAWDAYAKWHEIVYSRFNADEAYRPICPFDVPPSDIDAFYLQHLQTWAALWTENGKFNPQFFVGMRIEVRDAMCRALGNSIGFDLENLVDRLLAAMSQHLSPMPQKGDVRDSLEGATWAYIGSLVHGAWPNGYPYSAAAELWRHGLVPLWDGAWQFRGGPQADVLWVDTSNVKEE